MGIGYSETILTNAKNIKKWQKINKKAPK